MNDDPEPPDLSALGLSGRAGQVLAHLLRAGERSVAQVALDTGIADSVASRAVRDLAQRGLVSQGFGRPATVAVAPDIVERVRGVAADVRAAATRRADALEALGTSLESWASPGEAEVSRYWLVPMRVDAPMTEQQVRAVAAEFDACVPRGRRPRGVPRRLRPGRRVRWRVLVEEPWPTSMATPGDTDLEVRRANRPLPWLELLDDQLVAVEVVARGCRRTAWCADGGQVALARAGFERWWEEAAPQSTREAQPFDRATAARQRR